MVFLHQFGGNRESSYRHQDMVLDMGHNSFAFDLRPGATKTSIDDWARDLKRVLDSLQGDKILYTFSFPSVAVPALLGRRQRADVRGWISDGGPFCDVWHCVRRLLAKRKRGNPIARLIRTWQAWRNFGGFDYDVNVRRWLESLDPEFPILSIRATADQLVPVHSIDRFFDLNQRLNLTKFTLEGVGHLEGLRRAPENYRRAVENFLKTVSARRSTPRSSV